MDVNRAEVIKMYESGPGDKDRYASGAGEENRYVS